MPTDLAYSLSSKMASIFWDPNPILFTLPYFDIPLRWYGLLFAFGFVGAFALLHPLLKRKLLADRSVSPENASSVAYNYIDRLLWFIILGTVIGARLGHVFFYEWPRYSAHPAEIFKIWEGGLASHGGTIGVLLAVFLYSQWTRKTFPNITFLQLCDLLTIPAAFITICIRLGNFVNQEILGTPSTLPWAVIFGHPADGSAPIARHPVQLYEAIAYLVIFGLLWTMQKQRSKKVDCEGKAKERPLPPGFMTGLFFVLVFGSRFLLEFFKAPQSMMIDESAIQTGQLLSLPFILLGLGLMIYARRRHVVLD